MRKVILMFLSFVCVMGGLNAQAEIKSESVLRSDAVSKVGLRIDENSNQYPVLEVENLPQIARTPVKSEGPMKVGPTGSTILGWRSFDQPKGWFELGTDGTETMLWQNSYLEPAAGFIKDGKLYSYYAKNFMGQLSVYYYINDLTTGEILESGPLNNTDASQFVLISAYDSDQDIVYAYTYSADGATNWIQAIDPDTQEFTKICEPSEAPRLISYNPIDGKIYGISKTGDFIRLNVQDGSMEVIGSTGFTPSKYKQTMTYSPIDKKFIWAALMEDLSACVIAVDPITGEGEKLGDLPLYTEYNILVTTDELQDDTKPSAPEILDVDFYQASFDGKVKVKMPTTTFGGEALGDVALVLVSYLDDVEYAREEKNAGEEVLLEYKNLTQGLHKFSFKAILNVEGKSKHSAQVSKTHYIGYDIPMAPKNVILEPELVKWDAVFEGVNGGYIDVENMTYDVYINGTKYNTEPLSDTSYVIELPAGSIIPYYAEIVAVCHGLSSEKGVSNKILYGDAYELPVSFLPAPEELDLFKIYDANGDGCTILYDYNRYAYTYRYDNRGRNSADDWLFLPIINFPDAEKFYQLKLEAWAFNKNYPESFELAIGKSQNPESMTIISSYESVSHVDPQVYSVMFKVPESGSYYLAVHVNSKSMMYDFFFRNFEVTQTNVSANSPAAFENLNVVAAEKGALKAFVSCEMPTLSVSGDKLDENKELKLVASSSVESVEVLAKPGESVDGLELQAIQGSNQINVALYDGDIKAYEETINVYVGLAVPGAVSEIKATLSDDNLTAHVTWKAPTKGATEGYLDPESVEYYYYDYDWDLPGWVKQMEIGNKCEFDLTLNPGDPLQTRYVAIISANEIGVNTSMPYITVVIGTPYEAPMEETFSNGVYAYSPVLILSPDAYHNASCTLGDPQKHVPACVSQDGFALVSYTNDRYYNSYGLLSLPKFSTVDLEEAKFVVTAWLGETTATTEIYASAPGVDSMLIGSFGAESNNEWAQIECVLPEELLNKGWVEIRLKSYYYKDMAYSIIDGYALKGSGANSVEKITNDIAIRSAQGMLIITGAEGLVADIYMIDGVQIYSKRICSELERIALQSGVYVVKVGDKVSKVMIK